MAGGSQIGLDSIPVGPLEVNCYILWDKDTKDGFVIDPGGDARDIIAFVKRNNIKVDLIVNTHGHFDHVGGNAEVKAALNCKVAVHEKDASLLEDAHEHGVIFGVKTPKQSPPDVLLKGEENISAGGITLKVIHTPGHTRGGICLFLESERLLFTGDTLFAGSIGRTDFEGGSYSEIMDSIKEKILPLGDNVRVFPGHGPESDIGFEKRSNPYLGDFKE